MPLLVFSFLTGIVIVQQFSELPNLYYLAVGCILAIACGWKRYWHPCVFILGILWATVYAQNQLNDRLDKSLENQALTINGCVADLPKISPRRVQFDFLIQQSATKLPKKIRLSWYNATEPVKAGQCWQFTVKLKRPHSTLNPAGFDYEGWLFSQGIGATGYVRKSAAKFLGMDYFNVSILRQMIADRLDNLLPNNENVGLIRALSIGDGQKITQHQWEIFRKTGTTHLIVISGSHITLVAGFVFFLVRKIWIRTCILAIAPYRIAALIAFIASGCYAALAGFSVPTQRAMVMVMVLMWAIFQQRHTQVFYLLALAVLITLLLNPLEVITSSFWLSFVAVFMLLYCYSYRFNELAFLAQKHLQKPLSSFFLRRKICQSKIFLQLHFIMAIGLTPLLLFYFQQFSLISPVANAIAVPVIEVFTVPLILISIPLVFIYSSLAKMLLLGVAKILAGLMTFLSWLTQTPTHTFYVLNPTHLPELKGLLIKFAKLLFINYPQPSALELGLAMLGILLFFAPKALPARYLSLVLCLPLLFASREKIAPGELKLTILDVGQGLATVVQTANHLLVFDSGAKLSNDFDMGKAVVLPFLHSLNAQKIDRLIISHGDNDHSGGANSIVQEIKTDDIYTSATDLFPQAIACHAGQQWEWDKVQFLMLSPGSTKFAEKNNNSCVLKITALKESVLFTGDIEIPAENELVTQAGQLLKSEILIAPHHGSKTSSSLSFLQHTQPQWVFISAGYQNRFHFPHPSVIQRYQQLQIRWLMTGSNGAITVKIQQAGFQVRALRHELGKYWHDKP